jgi:hypothetical protein
MLLTLAPIVADINAPQVKNAKLLILVTEFGIVTDVKALHL